MLDTLQRNVFLMNNIILVVRSRHGEHWQLYAWCKVYDAGKSHRPLEPLEHMRASGTERNIHTFLYYAVTSGFGWMMRIVCRKALTMINSRCRYRYCIKALAYFCPCEYYYIIWNLITYIAIHIYVSMISTWSPCLYLWVSMVHYREPCPRRALPETPEDMFGQPISILKKKDVMSYRNYGNTSNSHDRAHPCWGR